MPKPKPAPAIKTITLDGFKNPDTFPFTEADKLRIADYIFFRQLFDGDHYNAFKLKVSDGEYNEAYSRLRYVYVNFAGMISRIVADMLFGEPVRPKMPDDTGQAWVEEWWKENNLNILLYESALTNSAEGDAALKLRVGPRRSVDDQSTVILEPVPPGIYYPDTDGFNVSAEPEVKVLAWAFEFDGKTYLRREIHQYGLIINRVNSLDGEEIGAEQDIGEFFPGVEPVVNTQIDRHIVTHIPNWKTNDRWNGYSDYHDLDSLFFSINNRMSKIDNVLDKHTDPILMVPEGVIDPKTGKARKDMRVIEIGDGEDGKPEYIVWDASLENAFKEIEKLVEFMEMVGEFSPDILGLGKGKSDSGRALKFKLMRTIAKVARKKLYYDKSIKESIYTAQLLSKAHNATVGGKVYKGTPVMPELIWQDGLPADDVEQMEVETKGVDAGLSSQRASIMKIHQVDEAAADEMIKQIDKEKKANMPPPLDPSRNPFNKNDDKNKGQIFPPKPKE